VNIQDSVVSQGGALKATLAAFNPDLLPAFRTSPSMISDEVKGNKDLEEHPSTLFRILLPNGSSLNVIVPPF